MDLFHKYGGADFWSEFLNIFYTKITSSDILSHHFVDKDINRIKCMLIELLEISLIGETEYEESMLTDSHKYMRITNLEFETWISFYRETMGELGVEDQDANSVIGFLRKYKTCIVTA